MESAGARIILRNCVGFQHIFITIMYWKPKASDMIEREIAGVTPDLQGPQRQAG